MREFEWLKVTDLNLFHPTASPFLKDRFFSYCGTVSARRGRGRESPSFRGLGRKFSDLNFKNL